MESFQTLQTEGCVHLFTRNNRCSGLVGSSTQRTYIRGMLWNSKDLVIIYGLTLTHEDVSRQGLV